MPIQPLRERLPRRALATSTQVMIAATVLVATMSCGSHDSAPGPVKSAVPNLDLSAVRMLPLEANDSFGIIDRGVYTVVNGDVHGVDSGSGQKLWWIQPQADKDKIQVLDSGRVLLVGSKDKPGSTAYDADTGLQLFWSTPSDQWFEADDSSGQFVHNDPRTGKQLWTVDPGKLGCATPLSKDLPALFDSDGATLEQGPGVDVFRCAAPNGKFLVGGLDRATGASVWHREVPEKGSFLRGPGQMATVKIGDTVDTVDMANGKSLGSRKQSSDKELRIPFADGTALTLDSYVIAEDKDMRLVEPGGTTRWTVALDEKEETQPLMASGGNAVFALMRQRADSDYRAWLVAYDTKTGKRTVLAGPGATSAGEKPTLTMNLKMTDTHVYSAPWGLLIAGPDNGYAVIPVQH